MIPILIITLMIYVFMIIFTNNRTAISFIGAGALLITGVLTSSFDVGKAFSNFPSEIIILIIVLALFTDIFERMHLIDYIGYLFIRLSKGRKALIIVTIPLLMYATSLFMNNLTVVLLFTYMALYLAIEYKLPIIPLLVSVVIGSNIGGAPLPWADTPAVVLTLYSDFNLLDFLNKLFLPCLVYVLLLSVYTYVWYRYGSIRTREIPFKIKPNVKWRELRVPMFIFFVYIVFVSVAPFLNISIAYVSLLFGGILLIIDKKNPMDALNDLPLMDSIAFLIALFLIGGVLESSGVLSEASQYIIGFTNNNKYFLVLSILFISFFIATFLSAGPAAATLLPICLSLSALVPFKLIYAALALGILSGSSMLPWSATGGPILMSQTNRFLKKPHVLKEDKARIKEIFNLRSYLVFSIPFSFIMLIISAFYLCVYISFF